ncbi:MAG: hypothetical protein Q8R13_01410 [bacterium]|nr:hypothetical protein [bacterium]MDZ4296163.1 hypothetical protein [Patescibacteria group bacterium]
MRFTLPPLRESLVTMLRRAGYAPHRGHEAAASYVRRMGGVGEYPRFHLYADERAGAVVLNLHLDQKQPSYGQSHAHSGEYEGETVARERERIMSLVG